MRLFYLCVAMLVAAGLAGCQQESSVPKKAEVASDVVVAPNAKDPVDPVDRVEKSVESVVEKVVETVKEEAAVTSPVVAVMKEPEKQGEIVTKEVIKTADPIAVEKAVEKPVEPVVSKTAALGDVVKGGKLAKGKCGACHYFDQAKKKVGPSLMGIYGRAPSVDGLSFATWDATSLDQWIANPKAVKSNTKMAFKGIAEKTKRDDIIAYLKTL